MAQLQTELLTRARLPEVFDFMQTHFRVQEPITRALGELKNCKFYCFFV